MNVTLFLIYATILRIPLWFKAIIICLFLIGCIFVIANLWDKKDAKRKPERHT